MMLALKDVVGVMVCKIDAANVNKVFEMVKEKRNYFLRISGAGERGNENYK